MLFFQHGHRLLQLALGAAALADKGADGLGQVAAKNGIQPLAHGPDAVGAFCEGGRVGVAVLLLAALHPALVFQPVEKIQHGGRPPAFCGQLLPDVPPGGGLFAAPHGQKHLFFRRRKRSQTVRDAIHCRVRPPFLFYICLCLFDFTEKSRFFQGQSFGCFALFCGLFYICLHFCIRTKHICAFRAFSARSGEHLCAKMLLFSHPQNHYTTDKTRAQCRRRFGRRGIRKGRVTLWHEFTISAQAPACCPKRS